MREGDTLAVWKLDRLARNLRHLIDLGLDLQRRGCQLVSLTEAIDTGSTGGKLVFAVFGAMAEFEADLNRERTMEARRAAKAAGRPWGRPSPFHDPENVRAAQAMLADPDVSVAEVARHFATTRNVIYRWFPGGDPQAFDGRDHRRAS